MARAKSNDKRNAITAAAIRVIALQGLSAPTALIAKEAGVSSGSLFTYFATKTDLLNQLYVDLKVEMASAALDGILTIDDSRGQMAHAWFGWLRWATSDLNKRRTLAQLSVSEEISGDSRELGHLAMVGVAKLLERSRQNGQMRDVPLALVAALMEALANTTIDFMIADPTGADSHRETGFAAMWRMLQ